MSIETQKNHKLNTLATDVLYKECIIQKKNIHKVHFTAQLLNYRI
jgi:hypothetical protein